MKNQTSLNFERLGDFLNLNFLIFLIHACYKFHLWKKQSYQGTARWINFVRETTAKHKAVPRQPEQGLLNKHSFKNPGISLSHRRE